MNVGQDEVCVAALTRRGEAAEPAEPVEAMESERCCLAVVCESMMLGIMCVCVYLG